MRDPNNPCLFCNTAKNEYILESELAYSTFDSYTRILKIPKNS